MSQNNYVRLIELLIPYNIDKSYFYFIQKNHFLYDIKNFGLIEMYQGFKYFNWLKEVHKLQNYFYFGRYGSKCKCNYETKFCVVTSTFDDTIIYIIYLITRKPMRQILAHK